ncbi:hypothetical protein HK19_10200 [Acetobacter persici]|nr:hypothetical protein HK19_10200 [Acetobacter persici]
MEVRLKIKSFLSPFQDVCAFLLQCMRILFECPSVLPQPAIEHAATDPDGPFASQTRHYFVKRDVFLHFDHAGNKHFMCAQL